MSNPEVEAILEELRKRSKVSVRLARFAGVEDGAALVDMGDQRFPVAFKSGGFIPQMNEAVWVETIDGVMFMTGPASGKPGVGTVTTVAGPQVTVATDAGVFQMPFAGEAPSSGDTVGLSWSSDPWCAKLSTSPVPPPPPPAPPSTSGPKLRSAVFRATEAGSTDRHQSRYWTNRVLASNSTFGVWTYGDRIKDTIPASAEFVSLEIYVAWAARRTTAAPRWVLHNLKTRNGVPSVTAFTEWDPNRWGGDFYTPPGAEAWFNALKAGGSQWGVGLNQGGWEEAKSLIEDGQSGALRIKWRA